MPTLNNTAIQPDRQATAMEFHLAEPGQLLEFAPESFQDDIVLACIEKGGLKIRGGGDETNCGAGKLLIFWSSIPHEIYCAQAGTEGTVIRLPLDLYLSWAIPANITQSLMGGTIITDQAAGYPSETPAVMKRCSSELKSGIEECTIAAYFELQSHLWRIARKSGSSPFRPAEDQKTPAMLVNIAARSAGEMASYITHNFKKDIRVSAVLRSTQFSQTHALRLFKNKFGVKPNDYLTRHRILYACNLLRGNEHRVSEIAILSGFRSASRFFAVFKSKFGVSPNVYRQRHHRPATHPEHVHSLAPAQQSLGDRTKIVNSLLARPKSPAF